MMKRVIVVLTTLLLASASSGMSAQAQTRSLSCNNNGARLGQNLVERVSSDADRFQNTLSRALDRSSLNNSSQEDKINQLTRDFVQQANRVSNRFERCQSVYNDYQQLRSQADQIDNLLQRLQNRNLIRGNAPARDWATVRSDMTRLEEVVQRSNNNYNRSNDDYFRR